MLFSRLALAAIIVTVLQAQKEYWIDPTCPPVVWQAVEEAKEVAQNVLFLRHLLNTPSEPEGEPEGEPENEDDPALVAGVKRSFQEVLDAIFPGATQAQLQPIWESYQSLSTASEAEVKLFADVLIYCDNDEDWVEISTNEGVLRGYWDPNDYFVHFVIDENDPTGIEQPLCRDPKTLAGTYPASLSSARPDAYQLPNGKITRITICKRILPGGENALRYPLFAPLKTRDLSRSGTPGTKAPMLDNLRHLTTHTLVHEWHHIKHYVTDESPLGEPNFIDVQYPNSYGWQNIRRLALQGFGLTNADSVAYLGLAAQVIRMGMTSTIRKKVYYFDLTDSTIRKE